MSNLAEPLEALFMHDPDLAIVHDEHGSSAVVLVIDGWYAPGADEWGIGVESVLPFWRELLRETTEALETERAS